MKEGQTSFCYSYSVYIKYIIISGSYLYIYICIFYEVVRCYLIFIIYCILIQKSTIVVIYVYLNLVVFRKNIIKDQLANIIYKRTYTTFLNDVSKGPYNLFMKSIIIIKAKYVQFM